jgi:hypothetical protein
MKAQTLFNKAAAGLGTVALALTLSACSHHNAVSEQTSGEIRTEAAAQQKATPDQTVGTAPAPANAQGATVTSTPAVISGPATVDNSGRVYTSSSVGATGNASSTGLNTNVNIIPKTQRATVVVTQEPAPTVETTTTVETAPAPAPPVVTEPMTSSTTVETPVTTTTTTETTTTHRRMRKD